jgi:hypothetical protein
MVWKYEKFKGDGAIYAFCPKCGFYHNPSRLNTETMQCEIIYQYNLCPMCGTYLFDENPEAEVIWDERDIVELYKNS